MADNRDRGELLRSAKLLYRISYMLKRFIRLKYELLDV